MDIAMESQIVNDELVRQLLIDGEASLYKKQVVLTKEEFLMAYKAWVEVDKENEQ